MELPSADMQFLHVRVGYKSAQLEACIEDWPAPVQVVAKSGVLLTDVLDV